MSLILNRFFLYLSFWLFAFSSYGYVPVSTDSRIKTLIYSPSEIFYLTFHYNYQSYIEFPEDENINIITLGDRYSWNVKKVGRRLFIKPYQIGVSTNMTIITDKHQYHFEIFSSSKKSEYADPKLAFVVKFFYPDSVYDYMNSVKIRKPIKVVDTKQPKKEVVSSIIAAPVEIEAIVTPEVELLVTPEVEPVQNIEEVIELSTESLPKNYKYSMVGDQNSPIKPFMVYDDGVNTYFVFDSNILPDIFVVNQDGMEIIADYRIIDNQVVINNTSWQYSLRNNKEVVCIFNDNITGVTY